tara:strand:- start:290 stop:397 length:108 start_codon:yes stop_codon:yes gene_type:complete
MVVIILTFSMKVVEVVVPVVLVEMEHHLMQRDLVA